MGINQQAELLVQRLIVWISQLLPIRPGVEPEGPGLDRERTRTRRSHVDGLGWGKPVGVKVLARAPEGPEGQEDFALGVQPCMRGGACLAPGSLIEIPDRPGAAFGGLEEGAIADGLQGAVALAIELFKAQGFAVTGAVADGQAAIPGQAGEFGEAVGILDISDEEMGADQADARNRAQALDFGERATGLTEEAAGVGLTGQGLIQGLVKEECLGPQGVVGQLFQPSRAARFGKDGGAGGEEAPVLEEGFDLELEAGLAQDGLFVGLGGAFEEDALVVGGLPDGFEFIEAQEAGQGEGVAPVVFMGILADEAIAAGIANDQLLDVGFEQLADPAGQIGFLEHEAFVGGGDGLDVVEELLGIGGETPPAALGALIVQLGQNAISGVGIQPEPCYRRSIRHREPWVMVDRFNNLADAGRIRICSFTESRKRSIQQVVRFSIYQQATRDGRSSSAVAEDVIRPACLSSGR